MSIGILKNNKAKTVITCQFYVVGPNKLARSISGPMSAGSFKGQEVGGHRTCGLCE